MKQFSIEFLLNQIGLRNLTVVPSGNLNTPSYLNTAPLIKSLENKSDDIYVRLPQKSAFCMFAQSIENVLCSNQKQMRKRNDTTHRTQIHIALFCIAFRPHCTIINAEVLR